MDLCSMRWVQTLWPKHLPLLAEFGVSYEYTLHSGWSCPERWFAWGRKSGIVRGKWWYELWDMNYMNKGQFSFWETTNQQTKELDFHKQRNTKQPQHETTERTNKKSMSWTMGLSFTSKLFGSNERCSDFWNWRWILMRHVSHMELQQSIRWVAGVSRVGPWWFLWCRFFHVGKKWSDLACQANQAALGGHCEVLQLLQNFGAVLWQKTGVADGLGAYEVVGKGGWRAVWR